MLEHDPGYPSTRSDSGSLLVLVAPSRHCVGGVVPCQGIWKRNHWQQAKFIKRHHIVIYKRQPLENATASWH